MNTAIELCIFKLVMVISFSFNWRFWVFRLNFSKKGIPGLEEKKWTPPVIYSFSNYSRYQVQIKAIILNFGTKFIQKGYFRWKKIKSEHHHWILHIRVRLSAKFQFKLTILIFGPNLLKKGISGQIVMEMHLLKLAKYFLFQVSYIQKQSFTDDLQNR